MADLVIPDGYANVSFIFANASNSHQFGFSHGIHFGTFLVFGVQDIADDAKDAFLTGYTMANVYNAWTFVRTHVIAQNDGDLFSADSFSGAVGTGGSSQVNTPNLAMIVKKGTQRAGKKFRGRMYWPCLSLLDADVNNAGIIDPTVLSTIQGNVDDFRSSWEAKETVESFSLLHASTTSPLPDPTEVLTWSVESLCGTQRRRMR